jgi:type II secretory pathway predicted ATPase ExeA
MNEYEYYTKFDWPSNPFTLTITPELMVGYSEQSESLLSHIHNLHKFGLVIGPTGAGKTTLLMWLRAQLMAYKKFFPFYVSKPPRSPKNLILLFKSIFGYGFLDKLRFKRLTPFNISRFVFSKIKGKHFILLIDEAHESSINNLEWIRTIVDSTPNISVIFASLPVFEEKLTSKLPTLSMRISTKVYLNSLSRSETESLIVKRIENTGSEGLRPFTSESVDRIFEITGGFPREIIKSCDKLVKNAAEKNISTISKTFVDQILKTSEISKSIELKVVLSRKQKNILKILDEKPNLTPTEIVSHLELDGYKDRNNAVRSVNNILRRLLKQELIQRKSLGNSYVYFLSGIGKTLFGEA